MKRKTNRSSKGKVPSPEQIPRPPPTLPECLPPEDSISSGPPSPIPSPPSPISSSPSSELPREFTYMKNEYEVAAWVSDHPQILDLAISIRKAKRRRIDSDSEDDDVKKTTGNNRREIEDRLYVESRALFLRTRNTSAELLDQMASGIINKKTSHPEISEVVVKISNVLSNLRYQVNRQFKRRAEEYRERYGNEISYSNEFVDDHVWRDILRLPLLGVVKMELNKDRVMCENLRKFVVKALEKWITALADGKNAKSDMKRLDAMTLELRIPTKYSITSRLEVRQLLLCK